SRGRELHARLLDPPGDGIGSQADATITTVALSPVRSTLDQVAYPEQCFDVIDECGAAKEANLERKRGFVAREATLAFDGLHQRRLLAADVGTRPTTQVKRGCTSGQLGDLVREDFARDGILVADIYVHVRSFDHVGADESALYEP